MRIIKRLFISTIRPVIRRYGLDVVQYNTHRYDALHLDIFQSVNKYTMTNQETVSALIEAVKYIVTNRIDGAMVECGVWKGGSIMAMALTLKELGDETREIYLYDTFSGMSSPSDVDISFTGTTAQEIFSKANISGEGSNWCLSAIEEVRENVIKTGYPIDKFRFVKGKVEKTIPNNLPKNIALLRLDTDFYESTKCELTHLFPLLSPRGVIIIDDYGYWEGQRKAVDEYISEKSLCILLNRMGSTGRIAIKIP